MGQVSFKTENPRATAVIAKSLAEEIIKTRRVNAATVVGLEGDLGAGKTTFVKSFMRALGVRQKLISPTFILMRSFRVNAGSYKRAFHADAYRVNAKSLAALDFKDILSDPGNIVLIEWSDRVKALLPKGTLVVNFRHGKKQNERYITVDRR